MAARNEQNSFMYFDFFIVGLSFPFLLFLSIFEQKYQINA